MKAIRYLQALGSFNNYYRSMNEIMATAFGRAHMLHYPFYLREMETLEERQHNLLEYCLSYIGDLKGKNLLEVGCGNGLNCHYIELKYGAQNIIGIDLSRANLDVARSRNEHSKIRFIEDNAQELTHIPDCSIDVMISIESAFHYPDKDAFFRQIKRVLRPEGVFLIADIVRAPGDKGRSLWFWRRSKLLHHASEEEYHQLSVRNHLLCQHTENITERIIRGYEGHLSWIRRENLNLAHYLLMKIFTLLQVRLNIAQLRTHKQYLVFSGRHADPV